MKKALLLVFGLLFTTAVNAQQLTPGLSAADGPPTSFTPTKTYTGTAPTTDVLTASYKKIGSNLYLISWTYVISTLGAPTGGVSFGLPTGITSAAFGQSCSSVLTNSGVSGGGVQINNATSALYFPSTWGAFTYFVTCVIVTA